MLKPSAIGPYAEIAAFTRSGDIGSIRTRLPPVSAATALAMEGATPGTPGSPMPVGGLSVAISLISTAGTSAMRKTRYLSKFNSCTSPLTMSMCS